MGFKLKIVLKEIYKFRKNNNFSNVIIKNLYLKYGKKENNSIRSRLSNVQIVSTIDHRTMFRTYEEKL